MKLVLLFARFIDVLEPDAVLPMRAITPNYGTKRLHARDSCSIRLTPTNTGNRGRIVSRREPEFGILVRESLALIHTSTSVECQNS